MQFSNYRRKRIYNYSDIGTIDITVIGYYDHINSFTMDKYFDFIINEAKVYDIRKDSDYNIEYIKIDYSKNLIHIIKSYA